ncbi:MAG: small basic protein [Planctomycetota bacterium]
MSIHRSLAVIGKLKRHRNVLKKSERLERLLTDGKPEDEISIFALPKLRNIMLKAKPKAKKEEAAAEGAPAEGAAAAPAAAAGKAAPTGAAAKTAAPAAGAKPVAKAEAPKADKKK